MNKLWAILGNIAFWVTWPLLFVYLYFSERTRVLVIADGKVLVVKGWLSSGTWDLPGGGLHRREAPEQGALRELREETGILPVAKRPQFVFSKRTKNGQGLSYTMHAFVLELNKPLPVTSQRFELIEARWMPWRDLHKDPQVGPDVKDLLATWFKV